MFFFTPISLSSDSEGQPPESSQLEQSANQKTDSGKTQFEEIIAGLSKSVSSGFTSGFQATEQKNTEAELAARDKLKLEDVQIVAGNNKTEEKVIGIIKNESDQIISNIRLSAIFKDKNGKLIDVSGQFNQVQGILKPNEQIGFEIRRQLGDFRASDAVLESKKAASVEITITDMTIIQKKG